MMKAKLRNHGMDTECRKLKCISKRVVQGVPQLSIHFVSVILLASTHPKFKS